MIIGDYCRIVKNEFKGYNSKKLSKDLIAGITTAAVSLPIALAFGVASGATAAAGLVTAVISGIVIGALAGASYQISGPTGSMTAVLVTLVAQYGYQGFFIACFLAGIIRLLCGIFKVGGLVSYLPAPVITGFTSGIAIIIALGQVNNLTGLESEGLTSMQKIISFFRLEQTLDWTAIIIGAAVILFMVLYPKKLNNYLPSSLMAIILATIANLIINFGVEEVGNIPKSMMLSDHLDFSKIDWSQIHVYITPAISIAALGMIETLLCGASAGKMTGKKLNNDVELVAQGIGNMITTFFGGVPATAAFARTSVAIRAGGQTRLTSIFHGIVLLICMFLLGGFLSHIPLAALGGVLIVVAFRMNDWDSIKFFWNKKIKTAMLQYLITMVATVVFDLTTAILLGVGFSIVAFIVKVSDMQITVAEIDPDKLDDDTLNHDKLKYTCVVYISGPLYFGTCAKLEEKVTALGESYNVIFSMRGVTVADVSGINALKEYCELLISKGIMVYFSCVQPPVMDMMERCGMKNRFKDELFFWSADKAMKHISDL